MIGINLLSYALVKLLSATEDDAVERQFILEISPCFSTLSLFSWVFQKYITGMIYYCNMNKQTRNVLNLNIHFHSHACRALSFEIISFFFDLWLWLRDRRIFLSTRQDFSWRDNRTGVKVTPVSCKHPLRIMRYCRVLRSCSSVLRMNMYRLKRFFFFL